MQMFPHQVDESKQTLRCSKDMASVTAEGGSTSFLKRGKSQVPHVQGTRQSVQSAQLLTSSGVPSLDHLIGGSLPVGTLLLIEEDTYGTFAKVILKYFLAEGVANGHALFLGSLDLDPQTLINQLPSPVGTSSEKVVIEEKNPSQNESMTIAWRYQNMRQVQSAPGVFDTQLGHNFDLTTTLSADQLQHCNICLWAGSDDSKGAVGGFINPSYGKLLRAVQQRIQNGEFRLTDQPAKHNILRLALHSLASPFWISETCMEPNIENTQKDLSRFLFLLHSLLRDAYAVAVVTIPMHLFENPCIRELCEHQSDFALRFESFAGSSYETNPAFKDYHGLLHIHKIGSVNSLAAYVPESLDLGFKLKRKKFVIEKLHLPPELQESAQREQDDIAGTSSKTSVFGCAAGQGSKLDF